MRLGGCRGMLQSAGAGSVAYNPFGWLVVVNFVPERPWG